VKGVKQAYNDLRIDSALTDAISAAGADPMTRAVALGERRLDNLDPSASDFPAKVEAAVAETIAKYPNLKQARAAGGSTLDLSGTTPLGAITVAQFKAMSPSELAALQRSNPTLFSQLNNS
jgi:hypothetical protein